MSVLQTDALPASPPRKITILPKIRRIRPRLTFAPPFPTMPSSMKAAASAPFFLLAAALALPAADTYQKPPKDVLDALNAPTTPTLFISPTRTHALQARAVRNPSIAELSQPMLRLAGQRINPKTNGLHNGT